MRTSNTASGLLTLFGYFAGLCAIFALVVTILEWREEVERSRWPLVPATVARADVGSWIDMVIKGSAGTSSCRTMRQPASIRLAKGGL